MGGRGKRRRNIAQKHGGAKDGAGVNVPPLFIVPSWLARWVASSRDQRSEIRCYGRVLLELSDVLPDLDEFLDVSSP